MGTRRLAEVTVEMIIAYIKANISASLDDTSADTDTNRWPEAVSLEDPRNYLIAAPAQAYTTPTVIVYLDNFDYRPSQKGANHINAMAKITVACILEDRDLERLALKAYRYNDAFHEVLAQAEIVDSNNAVKLVVIVERTSFTPEFSNAGDEPLGTFRKELHLECSVEHYSNF